MAVVSMKSLLESGVHFGHQTRRWDPRMKPYIFARRNGVHIIDLQKTMQCIKMAYEATRNAVLAKQTVLFVGTKKQARQAIEREAKNCGMFYVNNRWLGGTLTNFATIKQSLLRLKKLEKMEIDGTFDLMSKKEVARLTKEKERLERNQGGIKDMKSLPGLIFIIDTNKESIAVKEARSLNIPIVAVVDTNCNPEPINYPIPGNDDAIRATSLFTHIIAQAVTEADNKMGVEIIENMQGEFDQQDLYGSESQLLSENKNNGLAMPADTSALPTEIDAIAKPSSTSSLTGDPPNATADATTESVPATNSDQPEVHTNNQKIAKRPNSVATSHATNGSDQEKPAQSPSSLAVDEKPKTTVDNE